MGSMSNQPKHSQAKQLAFISRALDESDLDAFEFRILAHLMRRGNSKGESWPSQKLMQEITRISERSIRDSLRTLEEKGFIETRKTSGNRNVYRTLNPLESKESPAGDAGLEEGDRQEVPDSPAGGAGPKCIEGDPLKGIHIEGFSNLNDAAIAQAPKRQKFGDREAASLFFEHLPPEFRADPDFPTLLGDFIAERRENKPALTHRAVAQILRIIEGNGVRATNQALRDAIAKGWKSLYFKEGSRANKPKDPDLFAKNKEWGTEASKQELDEAFGAEPTDKD